MGHIYNEEEEFNSSVTYYLRAAEIYSSLKKQSKEAQINIKIGSLFVKLKDFNKAQLYFKKAKLYFEKIQISDNFAIDDQLSLGELCLILGDYDEAFDLCNTLITDENEKISDDERYLALLFLSISSLLLNEEDNAYDYLNKIGEFDSEKVAINWDFSDIEPVLGKTGEYKQLFTDIITLLKGDVKYQIIRLKDVKIINEEKGKQAELFHPFTGTLRITKDDNDLGEIMKKLSRGVLLDFDTQEMMGIPHNKALLILGFLLKKGFLDYENTDNQKFDLKLTERGLKVWEMRGSS